MLFRLGRHQQPILQILYEAMMLFRTALAISLIVLGTSTTSAQTADPTFNGLAKIVHCNMSTTVFCTGPDTCAIIDTTAIGPGANMWISLADRRIAPQFPINGPTSLPIEILEASPASLNSTLLVRFGYPKSDKGDTTGLLLFFPRSNGGFDIRFGQTVEIKTPKGSPAISRLITGGTCNIQNSP
jgi:hypothetical protein